MESIKSFNDISGFLSKPVNPQLEYTLLKEELDEYIKAVLSNDVVEVKDALADLMVVLYGTILKHGLEDEFSGILKEVCKSNMSKFAKTQEEALESVKEYGVKGVEAYYSHNKDHNVYVIKRADGKTLKSINFRAPRIQDTV